MSQPLRKTGRGRPRKRNKSSPTLHYSQLHKKHRTLDFDNSLDSDTGSFIDTSPPFAPGITPIATMSQPLPTTSTSTPAAKVKRATTKVSIDDIEKLGELLGNKLKTEIVAELKNELTLMVDAHISAAIKPLATELELVKADNADLRTSLGTIKRDNEQLKSTNETLQSDLDELDQYGRRMCLELSNIPGDTGDFNEDVEHRLLDLATNAVLPEGKKLDLLPSDIDRCHRRGRYRAAVNRRIIIKFTNTKARQRVWDARKQLGNGIYVTENLTRFRENLAYQARQLTRGPARLLERTWVAGGRIHAITAITQQKLIIRNLGDIEKLKAGAHPPHTAMD
ncbi:MAG: hypothetical protein ABW185_02080 [Sedimenticola sp.]